MKRLRIAAATALLADVLLSLLTWARTPAVMPVHWNFQGVADRFGSRWELALLIPAVIVVSWLLFEALPKLDPRFAGEPHPEQTERDRFGGLAAVAGLIFALLVGLHALALGQALGLLQEPQRLHALLLSAFLLVFGNFIGRLRPSWFVGIRTPWTLSNDEVWRRTHRLAGRLMVPAGLLGLIGALVLPPQAAFQAALVLLIGGLLVPAALSWAFFRQAR